MVGFLAILSPSHYAITCPLSSPFNRLLKKVMISFSWRFDFALFPTVLCRDTHQHHPENQRSKADADQIIRKKNYKMGWSGGGGGGIYYKNKTPPLPPTSFPFHSSPCMILVDIRYPKDHPLVACQNITWPNIPHAKM